MRKTRRLGGDEIPTQPPVAPMPPPTPAAPASRTAPPPAAYILPTQLAIRALELLTFARTLAGKLAPDDMNTVIDAMARATPLWDHGNGNLATTPPPQAEKAPETPAGPPTGKE